MPLRDGEHFSTSPLDGKIMNAEINTPVTSKTQPAELVDGAELAARQTASNQNEEGHPAPRPILPEAAAPEAFPVEALGPILSPAAKAMAAIVQAPTAIAGTSVLAVASLVVQAHANVLFPHGQERPVSLFALSIAASGERKSAIDSLAMKAVTKYMRQLLIEYEDAVERHSRAVKLAEQTGAEPPVEPPFPSFLMDDPTPEGLYRALKDGRSSQGLFSDEAGRFLGGHGMSLESRLRSATALSKIWDGGDLPKTRAGEAPSVLMDRRLSAHLMAQPGVAKLLIADPVMRDQGLTARLLPTGPDSLMGTRLYRDATEEEYAAVDCYNDHMLHLLKQPLPVAERPNGALQCRPVPFSAEAKLVWVEFYNEVERQLTVNGRLRPISGMAGKLPEHAGRIAAVLALVERLDAPQIEKKHMENAVELARHYVGEALRLAVAEAVSVDPELVMAEKFGQWLRSKHAGQVVTLTRILQFASPAAVRKAEMAHAMLAILEERGWVIRQDQGKSSAWQVVVPAT